MTKQPKLTPKMLAVLSELAKPKAVAYFMSGPDAYYFLSTKLMMRCTAQITGLVARGLAERFESEHWWSHKVRISAAGRKFLKGKP